MTEPANSYWSIETCAWVRFPRTEAEVPAPRAADEAEETEAIDLADLPSGVPV